MCYGQSYDGEISGLKIKKREVASNALFTHCCAHNLDSILMDEVNSDLKTKLFFGTIETVYTFFLAVYHVSQY